MQIPHVEILDGPLDLLLRRRVDCAGQAEHDLWDYDVASQPALIVVICAGGHAKLGTKMGDSVVAFALP